MTITAIWFLALGAFVSGLAAGATLATWARPASDDYEELDEDDHQDTWWIEPHHRKK